MIYVHIIDFIYTAPLFINKVLHIVATHLSKEESSSQTLFGVTQSNSLYIWTVFPSSL